MLDDVTIRRLLPSSKAQKFSDGKGLYLLMTTTGSRLWRFKYRFPPRTPGARENSLSFGSYPEVSLEQARKRRATARQDLSNGVDPKLRRKSERICVGTSFQAVAREFLSVLCAASIRAEGPSPIVAGLIEQSLQGRPRRLPNRVPISPGTVDDMEGRLERHVFPYIGERDVQLLTAPELLEVLRRIESRGTYNLGHRVRSICSSALRYARATGRRCEGVAADLVGILTPVACQNRAAIVEPAEFAHCYDRLRLIAEIHLPAWR
jgi:hypothetical protein